MIRVIAVADLPEGELVPVSVEGHALVAVRRGTRVWVYEDRCPHLDYPISVGLVEGREIVCTWHGAAFELETGAHIAGPGCDALTAYRAELRDGWLYVELPSGGGSTVMLR